MLFISIYRFIIPSILENPGIDYLISKGNAIESLFETTKSNIVSLNLDVASWDELFRFAKGENPQFLKNNYSQDSMEKRYKVNYVIVKDIHGRDLYTSPYDFIADKPMTMPRGFSASLNVYCALIKRQYLALNIKNADKAVRKSGLVLYAGIPYFISVMPIVRNALSKDLAGFVIFADVLDDAFFKNLTNSQNIQFHLAATEDDVEKGDTDSEIEREIALLPHLDGRSTVVPMSISDLFGEQHHIQIEMALTSYEEADEKESKFSKINNISVTLLISFFCFSLLLYIIIAQHFISPMEQLTEAIRNISDNQPIEVKKYSLCKEFDVLTGSINSMLEKLKESSVSIESLKKILDKDGLCISVINTDTGDVFFVNEEMKNTYNITDEDITDKRCWELFYHRTERCSDCMAMKLFINPNEPIEWEEYAVASRFFKMLDGLEKCDVEEFAPGAIRFYKNTYNRIQWKDCSHVHILHKMDITDLKLAEKAQVKRFKQQKFLTSISNSFISSENIETLINSALRMIGIFMNVSRVVLAKIEDGEMEFTYEWVSTAQNIVALPRKRVLKFCQGEITYDNFVIQRRSELNIPDTEADEKVAELYRPLGIKAFICVPIYTMGTLWGILILDECTSPRNWDESNVHIMHLIANSFSGLIIRNLAEQEILDAKESAERSSKAKTMFLARMSHEMRTPLNAIIGIATIAKSTYGDDSKIAECLSKINEASLHLKGAIDDVLDISNIEAGKFKLFPQDFELRKMIDDVVAKINFRIAEREQNFTVNINENLPFSIIADQYRLSQVISCLLSNANKFTPFYGEVSLDVSSQVADFSSEKKFHNLTITVSDNGIGISSENQKGLFQIFEQIDGDTMRKFTGVGIGLRLAKSIVNLMGGDINFESTLGKGSKFFVELTVEEGSLKDVADGGEESLDGIFLGKNILLVEDIEINQEIVIGLLENTGVNIECVENGLDAVKKFNSDPDKYDIVFMDVHMPGMDGFDATRAIRKIEIVKAKTIPIVAMTANVFKEDIDKCLACGMNDHIGKPIDFNELILKMKKYL
ncbi:MAG: response regulator [Treponema sp.]|jgi:signal transduction histidine kinase/CheY-like chemotaxis protein|nr:response regulator [Treponema sp.]